MFCENVINLHYLWCSQYFRYGSACWILGPYFYDIFSDSAQTGPLSCDIFPHLSQISSPFVTFYKIRRAWKTNSSVSIDPPIVFCLRGMNISCWSHLSDLHQIKMFFLLPKYNIMSPLWPTGHIGVMVAHMSAQLGMKFYFFRRNSKGCGEWGLNPQPHGHRKPLPLGYCFSFVVMRVSMSLYYVLGCWFGPVSIKTGIEHATCQVPLLRNESNTPVSCSCTESNRTHLSGPTTQKWVGPTC
jgi:hypothetical protein